MKPELSQKQLFDLRERILSPIAAKAVREKVNAAFQAAYSLGLAAGVAQERERAARVAESQPYKYKATRGIAAAIRAG